MARWQAVPIHARIPRFPGAGATIIATAVLALLLHALAESATAIGRGRSSIPAVSLAEPRPPLSASWLQAKRGTASGPLVSAGDEQGSPRHRLAQLC